MMSVEGEGRGQNNMDAVFGLFQTFATQTNHTIGMGVGG